MTRYFDISFEFNKNSAIKTILKSVSNKQKGYVCVVDGNVLAISHKNAYYKGVINNSLVNICDGSSIAYLAGKLHHQKLSSFTGPELFTELVKTQYTQLFLGNTEENLNQLSTILTELKIASNSHFLTLPFKNVGDFDYSSIARKINDLNPDIIWVSLGAPKQELFINNLYPLINKGILIAIGAAINIYIDEYNKKRTPKFIRNLHLEWLVRVLKEPKRIGSRALKYLIMIPGLIIAERKRLKKQNETTS